MEIHEEPLIKLYHRIHAMIYALEFDKCDDMLNQLDTGRCKDVLLVGLLRLTFYTETI